MDSEDEPLVQDDDAARCDVSLMEEGRADSEHVKPYMLEPMVAEGTAGLVPLGVAILWIMTKSGILRVRLDDKDEWKIAVDKLLPYLADGTFEVVGLRGADGRPEVIPSKEFALIKIRSPLDNDPCDFLLPFIDLSLYLGRENWTRYFNDRHHVPGTRGPAWTHQQVRKVDILGRWPRVEGDEALRPTPKAAGAKVKKWLVALMSQSPTVRTTKAQLLKEAREQFGAMSGKSFDKAYDLAIGQVPGCNWNSPGRSHGKSKTASSPGF
jgi:hypothetical protein